jgi:hypothetical protein
MTRSLRFKPDSVRRDIPRLAVPLPVRCHKLNALPMTGRESNRARRQRKHRADFVFFLRRYRMRAHG